jgi:hypothetical protein
MAQLLEDWSATERQTPAGAVESAQRTRSDRPVGVRSDDGARRLGFLYWRAVERSTLGLVRACERGGSVELRLLGGPCLLRFAAPELRVESHTVACVYPIAGGLLARRPAGAIAFAQRGESDVELASEITGFFPRLAATPGRPSWTGALYAHVQSRLHVAVSRRYFLLLAGERGR